MIIKFMGFDIEATTEEVLAMLTAAHTAIDVAIEALEAQNAVARMDLPKISEDVLKKMLAKMNHQQQLEWIVDGTVPNDFGKDTNVRSNDTISRQAVLDVILPYCPDDDGTCSKSGDDLRNMLDDIENLPSAQPELIRCKDCKHRSVHEGGYEYCHAWLRETHSNWYCSRGEAKQ